MAGNFNKNFNSRPQQTPSFFDNTTFLYLWKNSEVDPNDQDIKVLYDDLKADIQGNGQFTEGSILFAGATGVLTEDNANLYYDETLDNVGIGTNTPTALTRLELQGFGATAATSVIDAKNSVLSSMFRVRDNGQIDLGGQSVALNFGSTSNILLNQFGRALLRSTNLQNCTLSTALDFANFTGNNVKSINFGTILSPVGGNATANFFNNGAPGVLANATQIYGADIVAGNTAPHIQTESGDIIKIYSIGGWGDPTGTATRTAFDTSTVTLSDLAERVKALIDDFKTFGNLKA